MKLLPATVMISDASGTRNAAKQVGWEALCNLPKLLLSQKLVVTFNTTFDDTVVESSTIRSTARLDYGTSPSVFLNLYPCVLGFSILQL